MARTPFDSYAKDLTAALLAPYGAVESDARITSEPQFADVRFTLDTGRAPDGPSDFLTRDLAPYELIEFAHDPPDLAEMMSWMRKQSAWWDVLRKAAKRQKRELPRSPPVLRILSAGDPLAAREALWLRPVEGSPGCYEGPPSGTVRLVVISSLPRTRETLLARTMGAGATLRDALADLAALPVDAPERTLAAPFVVRLRIDLQRDPSPEAQESLMQAQKLYDELMRKQLNRGIKQGVKQGVKQGLRQGLQQVRAALRVAIEQTCEARGLKLTSALRAKLAAEEDQDVLLRWHARALTATRAREIFAEAG